MRTRRSIFLIACCLIACGRAKSTPLYLRYQDNLGQYSFGYSAPDSARSEIRTADGTTRGAYSYVDTTGAIYAARYVADDKNGFRIEATNFPQEPLPVVDTAEILAARAQHLMALEDVSLRVKSVSASSMNKTSEIAGNITTPLPIPKIEKSNTSIDATPKMDGKKNEIKEKNISTENEIVTSVRTEQIIGSTADDVPRISIVPNQLVVPIYRISHRNRILEPIAIQPSLHDKDLMDKITPVGTVKKLDSEEKESISVKDVPILQESGKEEESQSQLRSQQIKIASPVNIVPVGHAYSTYLTSIPQTFIRYVV